MTGRWAPGGHPDEPMDALDEEILRSLGSVAALLDPVPSGLVDRVLFAMTLDRLQAETMELSTVSAEPVGTRGAGVDVPEAATITFTSSQLSVMITVSGTSAGVRIDGWVAPAGVFGIELHRAAGELSTETDDDGRFVFTDVPHGRASLLIHCESPHQRSLGTPAFEL